MIVLGIETSCDETSVAIVGENDHIYSNIISSQVELHARFGGVVPEIASRNHLEALPSLMDSALEEASLSLNDIEGVAVTARPGLIGALLVGLQAAKSIAWALDVPIVGIHHLEAHIYAAHLSSPKPEYPYIALVVSGGHTSLFEVFDVGNVRLLGATRDDAAGEAYDKIAKMLGLGYPGGPIIDKLASKGDPNKYDFPMAMMRKGNLEFSFSGLKTAVRVFLQKHELKSEQDIADVCASVQRAIVQTLIRKIEYASEATNVRRVVVAGGVSANSGLRSALEDLSNRLGLEVFVPELRLCTDNGAMVAGLGRQYLLRGVRSSMLLNAEPYRPLGVEGVPPAGD